MGVTAIGSEILANTATEGGQHSYQVTSLVGGGYVVTWADDSHGVGGATGDTDGNAVKAQVFSATGAPIGSEILVNTNTANSQHMPQIAALSTGGFAIAWEDYSLAPPDSNQESIRAQVFGATGTPVGGEITVNSTYDSIQTYPVVTALSNGRFVVAWDDASQTSPDLMNWAVRAQVFEDDGAPVGGEIVLNTTTAGEQTSPTLTALSNGGFVAAWLDNSHSPDDPTGSAVRAQVFDADGDPQGGEILVNTITAGAQNAAQAATLSNGGFVVIWVDDSASSVDLDGQAVRAQVFTAAGVPVGTEILVNTTTAGGQFAPQITALSGGGFAIAWTDDGASVGDLDGQAVRAQIFSAAGAKLGGEILVNTTTAGQQHEPRIDALADGGFVVAWTDSGPNGGSPNGYSVRGQAFSASGARIGSEVLLNTTNVGDQLTPRIAATTDGFMAVWEDNSWLTGDTDATAVRAQVFEVIDDTSPPPAAPGPARPTPSGGGDGPDVTFLDEKDNLFSGLGGRDIIYGREGADTLHGNTDDDEVYGASGDDLLYGGKQADTLDGGLGDDRLYGDLGDDRLYGAWGRDVMQGGLGNDSLDGGDDADTVRGGQGDDAVQGGSGADWLSGDLGNDTLTGGEGADVFHIFATAGRDVVADFSAAQGDRVQLVPGATYTASQVGADTVVALTDAQLVLRNVQLSTLPDGWIFGA